MAAFDELAAADVDLLTGGRSPARRLDAACRAFALKEAELLHWHIPENRPDHPDFEVLIAERSRLWRSEVEAALDAADAWGKSSTSLHRCLTNPERVCRAKFDGCCQRCVADHHNPQLHRLHRAARALGIPFDVLRRAVSKGALDG